MTTRPNPLLPVGVVAVIDRLVKAPMRDSVCVIQRPISGEDASGAPIDGFATVNVVPCEVRVPGRVASESVGGARLGPVVDYEVRLALGVEVRSDWRILVNDKVLLVTADQDATSHGLDVVVQVKASES